MTLDLHAIRQQHGGTVYDGGRRWIGPGPGHSRRDASLSVRLQPDGRALLHSFAGDPFHDCAAHLGLTMGVAQRADSATAARLRREREAETRERRNRAWAFCEAVWGETQDIEGSLAERYLAGRGLPWPYSSDLRFHSSAPLGYGEERPAPRAPALVALVRSADGAPKGLHVTALQPDGSGKAPMHNPRRMFGAVAGCAVQLGALDKGELALAEGIETAMSFSRLKGVPCWAALSTSGLQTFDVPRTVSLLTVAVDGDATGRDAAGMLARTASRRCDAHVVDPGDGLDWNDVLVRERARG